MGRMQGEMQRSTNELQQIAREQQEILLGTEGVNNSALSERDSALKEKLDRFLAKALKDLGQLTQEFPDREGGDDDPEITKKLDDATMNQLVKNLIAKLLAKDFPGYGEGDKLARNELAKPRTPAQEPKAQRAEATLKYLKSELDALMGTPGGAAQALNDADRKAIRDLAQRQSALKERTEDLHEKLDSLFQLFPNLDPKILQGRREIPWVPPRSVSTNSTRRGRCPRSAAPSNVCRSRSSKCSRRCSKWRSAGSLATCR